MAEFNSCAGLIQNQQLVKEIQDRRDATPDPLQDMLDMQNLLQEKLAEKLPEFNIRPADITTKGQLIKWIDSNFDAIMDEMRELKTSVGGMSRGEKEASSVWKKWKANHGQMVSEELSTMSPEDRLEMQYELIDIWHFVLNMFLGLGLNSQDIYLLYFTKNLENIRRYESGY